MNLIEILKQKKKQITASWAEKTLDSYISSGFFKRSNDLFANPVGANIKHGLDDLYDLLLEDASFERFHDPLDRIIRIRAVQDFTPAEAVAPIMEIKWIVREKLSRERHEAKFSCDLDIFDCSVDRAALTAFDMYMACRDQLSQVRLNEVKSGRSILTDNGCLSGRGMKKGSTLAPADTNTVS